MRTAVIKHIEKYLHSSVSRYRGKIRPDVSFGPEGMALDSVEVLMLLMEVEDTFGVIIPPENYADIRSIGDLCAQVVQLAAPWDFCLNCKGRPEDVALDTEAARATYGNLIDGIGFAAEALWSCGVRPKDRVAILMDSGISYVVGYFSVFDVGAIPVLADPNDAAAAAAAVSETQADYILTGGKTEWSGFHELQTFRADETKVCLTILGKDTKTAAENTLPEQAVLVHYTSGSTGKPSGVVQSGRSYREMVFQYAACMGFSSGDRFLMCLPPFHGYGLSCVLLPALYSGAAVVLMERFLPRKALTLIDSCRISHFYGVPAMFELLLQADNGKTEWYKSIRYCCSSSLALDPQLISRFYDRTGIVIQQEYGSGETGVISYSLHTAIHDGDYSVGSPMQGVSCRFDEHGQLLVRSAGVALGYVSGEVFPEWYPTGDRAELADGQLYLRGRIKKLLDVGGKKVAAEEVDSVLQRCPGVRQAASFQLRESNGISYIGAFVCLEDGAAADMQSILAFCSQQLEYYKIPKKIIPVDDIPLSAAGKISSETMERLKQKYNI